MLSREPGHRPDEPRPIRSQLHHPTEKRLNRRRDNKSRAARCLNGAPIKRFALPSRSSLSLKTVSMTFAVSDKTALVQEAFAVIVVTGDNPFPGGRKRESGRSRTIR